MNPFMGATRGQTGLHRITKQVVLKAYDEHGLGANIFGSALAAKSVPRYVGISIRKRS